MKLVKKDNSRERMIITAMIVDPFVLGNISTRWEGEGLFPSTWSNLIGDWCVKYYTKYRKAPRKTIEHIFRNWSESASDPDTVKLVERFLGDISRQYAKLKKRINSQYVIDIAGVYFKSVSVKRLVDSIGADLDIGKVDDAIKRLNKFILPEIGVGAGIDLLQNKEALFSAFKERKQSVITYPGALERFYGDNLERDGFIAFMGPEKRGKTWHLLDLAWRGMLQRKRVAFFQVGDLSQRQMIMRFGVRASKIPLRPTKHNEPLLIPRGKLIYAEDVDDGSEESNSMVSCEYDEKVFKHGITFQDAWKAFQKVAQQEVRSKDPYMKLSCHPNSSITVDGIRAILQTWERQKWIPDIVVIDYADILAHKAGYKESREGINDTWKAMRRMSQELHCLVATATQANAASYTAKTLGMENFSEDKRKFAHVTGMIGINQTEEDKVKGIQSLNWLVLREDDFLVSRKAYIAGCLGIANPCIKSLM